MRNPRNYRKNPHTARFLQAFHAGTNGMPSDLEPTSPEAEAQAVSFVKTGARFTQPTASAFEFKTIGGFKVRLGGDLLTEKQAAFVTAIANTREGVTAAMRESLAVRLEQGFAKRAASDFIGKYKDLPRKVTPAQYTAMVEAVAPGASEEEFRAATAEVPAGRYALRADGVVKFYRLDRPTKGRWVGYTFLKAQASDELYPIRNHTEKARILAEIAKDVEGALCLYGQELGVCGDCGRTLTDETSRSIGRGPICRNK